MAVNGHNLSAIYGAMKSILLGRIPQGVEDVQMATVANLRGFRAIGSAVPDFQDLDDVYKIARDSVKHCPLSAAKVMIDWMNQHANLETPPHAHVKVHAALGERFLTAHGGRRKTLANVVVLTGA
jgi:hypothetical protein